MVGGLEHVLFSHILGIITPIDFHIFQRGSNHQPGYIQDRFTTLGQNMPINFSIVVVRFPFRQIHLELATSAGVRHRGGGGCPFCSRGDYPDHVPLEAMEYLWNPYGISMECPWNAYIHLGCLQ